jgi:hypothetical protein
MKTALFVVLCASIVRVPSAWANWVQDGVLITPVNGDYPQIVSDGAGGAIVAWIGWSSRNSRLYGQRVDASGSIQWTSNGVTLCPWYRVGSYHIISDPDGGAIITWCQSYNDEEEIQIYAQRVDALGTVLWTANGVAVCAAVGIQQSPTITFDGSGGAIITWLDRRDESNYNIFAQRVDASGAVRWNTNGIALCTEAQYQQFPAIVSDGAGGAIVTWEDFRSGNWDVYGQRVDSSGAIQWGANGIVISTAMIDQRSPQIISDDAGGAIITWYDYRGGNSWDVYAQRVNASGNCQWTPNGVALCTAEGEQSSLKIAPDGANGAIVSWHDLRSGDWDIYAQRVDASGSVQWTNNGVPLCMATGPQGNPTMISDGWGGAIITWMDRRRIESGYDIYAQRVSASGSIQWLTDGVRLCAEGHDQGSPVIASDGWGGAIVAWEDSRDWTDSLVYALRIDANGFSPLTDTDAPAVPVALHQNYPNPFNPATTISYSIVEKGHVTLKIFDASGRYVACLVDGHPEAGSQTAQWNGRDEKGNPVASGIYLYRLTADDHTLSKKMVLLR